MTLSMNWSLCLMFSGCMLVAAQTPAASNAARQTVEGLTGDAGARAITHAQFFDEPLIPSGEPTRAENETLVAALEQFGQRTVRDDFSRLTEFLDRNPDSPWAVALRTQLGREYFRVGRYSKAIEAWNSVWTSNKAARRESPRQTAHRAASELALMYARLGRMAELRALLADVDSGAPEQAASSPASRDLRAPKTHFGSLRSAREGLWSMDHRPEVSFRCGPLALDRICFATDRAKAGNPLIQNSQSTTNGFSAREVAELSRRLGMNYQVAFRSPGAEIILPAVVHWKVGHYAALIARDGKLLRTEDPTFDTSKIWLSDEALDEEASGYFLVRGGPLPPGWRAVSEEEAHQVWGKGTTQKSDKDSTTPYDEKAKECNGGPGMASWNVHLLLASQNIEDTPVGYTPPVGPPVYFTVTYNSSDAQHPEIGPDYSNVSADWRINWLAWIIDDPMNPFGDVRFAVDGGGMFTFTDYNATNGVFRNLLRNRANLVRTSTNSYEVRYPDGSKQIFDLPAAGAVGTARRIFMTAVVDPAGNAATIQFDSPGRITSITDAIGQKTRLYYEFMYTNIIFVGNPPRPVEDVRTSTFLVSRVVDPFGRTARFQFATGGPDARWAGLISITDSIGLSSTFLHGSHQFGLFIATMITPYGATEFRAGAKLGLDRANWMEITHPNGEKERVEYSEKVTSFFPGSEPIGIVPKGVPVRNYILGARNTCHWDRKAYAESYSPDDYTGARIYHWAHSPADYTTASPILESIKPPLEHRIWFTYEGQVNPTFAGSSDRPVTIARTLDDGTTQLYQFEYNSLGNPTKSIDPLGRTRSFVYAANEIDLLEVRQTRAGQNELLLSATYNSQHRPLTITDAAGQTTRFTYNARGQMLTARNARGDTNTYSYDTNGYLLAVDGPLPGTNDTSRFSYDNIGRLRTATEVDGYTLTFDYDGLDRLTRITYPDTTFEQIVYNRLDVEVLRDRAGRETRLTYDSLRQLVAVQDSLGRLTRYEWCGCDGLDAIIDSLGRVTRWIRDVQGRVKAKVYADGSQMQYDYDTATGWLKSIRDEQNQVTLLDYNLDGTLRQKRYLNAVIATPPVKFAYDANYPRVTSMEDGSGLTTYSYHPITGSSFLGAGQLFSVDGPLPNDTISFAYDELGREARRSINGIGVRRTWDAAGRLTQLTNALGTFTYSWEGASFRVSEVNLPNGQRSTFAYFPNVKDQLLQQITHWKPNSTLLSRFAYDYNGVRQITNWVQERSGASPVVHQLDYDRVDRLTNAIATRGGSIVASYAWSYDPGENLTAESANTSQRVFSHNVLNELTSVTNSAEAARAYEWDAENRLVAFSRGTHRTEFSYDGFDRRNRVVEKENGVVVSDRRYLWCDLNLCEERDATNANVLKKYEALGVKVYAQAGLPPGNYFYAHDHLGSIREMTDSSGQPRAVYDYTPFGRRSRTSGDLDSDFGFTGHPFHAASELHLAPFRAYDANLARWLSRDPIGEVDTPNLFAYVLNDPINLVDPDGLEWDSIYLIQPVWLWGQTRRTIFDWQDWKLYEEANFAGGYGDTVTFDLTAAIRQGSGCNQFVDPSSGAYTAGEVTGVVLGPPAGVTGGVKAGKGIIKAGKWVAKDIQNWRHKRKVVAEAQKRAEKIRAEKASRTRGDVSVVKRPKIYKGPPPGTQ
jgi:RHS repeat-associated protein